MLCAKVHKTSWPVNDVIWKTIRCAHKALNMNTLLELDVREKRTYDNMLRNTSNTSYLIDWYAYWNWNKWQTIKKGNTMFCTLVSTSWMYNVRRKHDMVHREPKREKKKSKTFLLRFRFVQLEKCYALQLIDIVDSALHFIMSPNHIVG